MAGGQVLKQPLRNNACLNESVVGSQFAFDTVAIVFRLPVQILIAVAPLEWLHRFHPEVIGKGCVTEVRQQIENHKRFKKLTTEWVALGIKHSKLSMQMKLERASESDWKMTATQTDCVMPRWLVGSKCGENSVLSSSELRALLRAQDKALTEVLVHADDLAN